MGDKSKDNVTPDPSTLTQDGPNFMSHEGEFLRKSPEALQLLIDRCHVQEAEADAIGEPTTDAIAKAIEVRRNVLEVWRDELLVRRGDRPGDLYVVYDNPESRAI